MNKMVKPAETPDQLSIDAARLVEQFKLQSVRDWTAYLTDQAQALLGDA